jgi:hypothetical protein
MFYHRRTISRAGKADDEIGRIAQQKSDEQPPHHDVLSLEPLGDGVQLRQDKDDGASGERQEEDEHFRRLELDAHNGTQERRAAGDEAEQQDERPRHPLPRKRSRDAKAFRHVVQRKANDEQCRQR